MIEIQPKFSSFGDVNLHSSMTSSSELGIGLGLVFGCLLLALVAELYYLLWWKKRISNREFEEDDDYSSNFHLICWKKPASLRSNIIREGVRDPEAH